MEVLTKSAQETHKLGKKFANRLKGGEILALVGQLGSGKTTFVQGLAEGVGVKKPVVSPTFVLVRHYAARGKSLYHVDLYRLIENVEREYKNLGLDEVVNREGNIVVIEWAEKVRKLLPVDTIWIKFKILEEDRRKVIVSCLF